MQENVNVTPLWISRNCLNYLSNFAILTKCVDFHLKHLYGVENAHIRTVTWDGGCRHLLFRKTYAI